MKNPKYNELDTVQKIDGLSCFQDIDVSASRVSCVYLLSYVEHASISLALTLVLGR